MGDFLRLILESINYLWPLDTIKQWERGNYYIFGRYWKTVGPGLYPVIPFFTSLVSVNVVPDVWSTPVQTITTKDGGTLTFSATIKLIVIDAAAATNNVTSHEQTAMEDSAAVLADMLAELEVGKLDPENRRRLLSTALARINKEISDYGMQATRVRFNNFVRNMRVYRLMGAQQ